MRLAMFGPLVRALWPYLKRFGAVLIVAVFIANVKSWFQMSHPYLHLEAAGNPITAVHVQAQDLLVGSFPFYMHLSTRPADIS